MLASVEPALARRRGIAEAAAHAVGPRRRAGRLKQVAATGEFTTVTGVRAPVLFLFPMGRSQAIEPGKVDMTFGVNPREGYNIGSTFYHPDMAFALDFPEGWKIVNQRQAVGAISPNQDAIVVLTLAQESSPDEAHRAFFAQEGVERGDSWRRGFNYFRTPLNEQQRLKLEGRPHDAFALFEVAERSSYASRAHAAEKGTSDASSGYSSYYTDQSLVKRFRRKIAGLF